MEEIENLAKEVPNLFPDKVETARGRNKNSRAGLLKMQSIALQHRMENQRRNEFYLRSGGQEPSMPKFSWDE